MYDYDYEGKGFFEKNNDLAKYKDTLKEVCNERVFFIGEDEGNYYLVENCDQYFAVKLTPELCNDLFEVFKILADKIENGGMK